MACSLANYFNIDPDLWLTPNLANPTGVELWWFWMQSMVNTDLHSRYRFYKLELLSISIETTLVLSQSISRNSCISPSPVSNIIKIELSSAEQPSQLSSWCYVAVMNRQLWQQCEWHTIVKPCKLLALGLKRNAIEESLPRGGCFSKVSHDNWFCSYCGKTS